MFLFGANSTIYSQHSQKMMSKLIIVFIGLMFTQYITVMWLDCYCLLIKLFILNSPTVAVFIRLDEAGI